MYEAFTIPFTKFCIHFSYTNTTSLSETAVQDFISTNHNLKYNLAQKYVAYNILQILQLNFF